MVALVHASDIVKSSMHAAPPQHRAGRRTDKPAICRAHLEQSGQDQYKGKTFPVNAKRETIWGVPCYKDCQPAGDPITCWCWFRRRFAVQVIREPPAAGAAPPPSFTRASRVAGRGKPAVAVELKEAVRENRACVTGRNWPRHLSAGENLFTNIDDPIVTMEAVPVASAGHPARRDGRSAKPGRSRRRRRYMVTTGNETGLERRI